MELFVSRFKRPLAPVPTTRNQQLHAALYERAALPQTSAVVASLLQKTDRYTRVQLSSDTARKRARREHGLLIELAREGAVDEACECLRGHIESVRNDLLRMLDSRGGARIPVQRRARPTRKA